ncbi:hypothetical protein BKA57DRAFT_507711 [Linnemannia elongata]|nr:hypothetical protein BKA57DRAFT_507711 [Linnemannia elongata]
MSHLQAVQVTYEALIDFLQFKSFLRKSLKTAISIAVYELRFQAGLYLWVEIDTRYLPSDKNGTHCLIRIMELLVTLKDIPQFISMSICHLGAIPAALFSEELRSQPTKIAPSFRRFFGCAFKASTNRPKSD